MSEYVQTDEITWNQVFDAIGTPEFKTVTDDLPRGPLHMPQQAMPDYHPERPAAQPGDA